MAKFKLNKNIAGAQSFRYNGAKYYTADVKDNQKLLKNILQIIPGNIVAHLKFIELSIKNGDT